MEWKIPGRYEKHNEANGWNNSDGNDDNRSWNCGAEGETDDPGIQKLRLRMMKNACMALNVYWEEQRFELPKLPESYEWRCFAVTVSSVAQSLSAMQRITLSR